jgi:VWA domain-containing protein
VSSRKLRVADAGALGAATRRAFRLRTALTLAIALLLAAAIVLAARGRGTAAAPVAPAGRSTEIVLDVSGSVSDDSYALMRRVLDRLARGRGRIGLVVFSDSAEEALPPGTPPSQLIPFARAFRPQLPGTSPTAYRPPNRDPNPWYPNFSGGTKISAGLATARQAIARDRARATVLLVSDLGDAPSDRPALRRQLAGLGRDGTPLRVIPLPNALANDRRWFTQLEGPEPFAATLPAPAPVRAAQAASSVPVWLAVVAGMLALALAAEALAGQSLRWGAAR